MRRFCRCLVLFIVLSSWLSSASAQVVNMPDANLGAAVRDVLGLGPNAPITRQAMQRLTRLDARDSQIKNLAGLEHATRLELLELRNNQVTDIRLLANLKNLRELILDNNRVRDIRVLAGMQQLTWLLLGRNPISDFTSLSNLTELRGLALWHNNVKDLTPLASMTKLTNLWLERNQISNITPLANLTNLKFLDLRDNQIRNVSLLRRLENLETLWLRGNPIQDTSPLADLTKLRDVDIEISATPIAGIIPDPNLAAVVRDTLGLAPNARITRQALQRLTSLDAQPYRIRKITGQEGEISNISGLEHATRLTKLWLTDNQIRNIGPLAGLTQLRILNIWGNPITDFRPLTGLKQLRALVANVRQIRDIQDHVDLTRLTELTLNGDGQQIRDTHLLANLTQLRVLRVAFAQVRDLSFLRNLTRLEELSLDLNQLSDLKPIVGLKQLKSLYIENNQIRNLQPLTGLKQLRRLHLGDNQVRDVSPLAGLTQLKSLSLWGNQVRDVSPLAGLVNLEALWLKGNPVQDASPLSNLPKLEHVDINIPRSPVVSIPDPNLAAAVRKALGLGRNAPITKQALQRLTKLEARENQIKDLTGLEHATQLRGLEVRGNQIRDIRPLAKLKSLKELGLDINPINNITPLANLTQLRWLLIGGSAIPDFTPLANLNQLEGLSLWDSNIGDVTLLANKTKLTHLWLGGNNISDIAPLVNLTQLKVLELRDNQIKNINPLVGLKKLEELSLRGNPIQDASPLRQLLKQNPNLELDIDLDTGPKIEGPWVWMIAPTGRNSGSEAARSGKDWLAAVSGGSVTERHIATNGAIPGAAVGNRVWTSGKLAPTGSNNIAEMVNAIGLGNGNYIEYHVAYGSLSLYSPQQQNTKMYVGSDDAVKVWLNGVLVHNKPVNRGSRDYQDTFSVTLKQDRNILLVAVYNGLEHWTGFFGFENDAVYTLAPTVTERPQVVSIPDRNLAAAMRKALNLDPSAPITKQAMRRLTRLDAQESQIKNLTGLEHATRLELLELRRNQITDIHPLRNLKNLKQLILEVNNVRDIRPLANMTQLTLLYIAANPISDFTPLANLTELRRLALWGNNISEVDLIADKIHLTDLHLWDNNIKDIRPLANLTQLQILHLERNQIRDVSPLANLKKLRELSLRGNPIQDTSPLVGLPNLTKVDIKIAPKPVPSTGTWLAIHRPQALTREAFTIGPGEFAIFVHNRHQTAIQKGDFNTYSLYSPIGKNTKDPDIPNLAHFFQNGGRIELISHATFNPLPPDTYEPQFGDVVISEILWGLDGTSPAKQYIELYNASQHTYTFTDGDLHFRFSQASEAPLPDGVFPLPANPNVENKVIDRVSNNGWKVPGRSGNTSQDQPLISMYRAIDYTTGNVPDGTLANSWKRSTGRVNLPAPSYGTPGAKHLPPELSIHVELPDHPPMYWIDTDNGTLHRLIGDDAENLLPGVQNAISLAVTNDKMYWTEDAGGNTGTVKRSNLDGSSVRVLAPLQSVPTSIAVDAANSKLYWTNSRGRIQTMNVNGGAVTNLIQNLQEPNTITLDTAGSTLYWGEPDSIWRADLNGRNKEAFAPNLGELRSIAIAGNRIYSIERPAGEQHWQLRSSTLDGLTPTQTLATLQSEPLSLAVDTTGGKLYWTNADGKIQRANLDGRNIQDVVTGLTTPGNIVLGIPTRTNPAAPANTLLVTHPLPVETQLLANYPNPFNPETWIPYQLATDTNVQILIYDARGSIVRRLGLGHQLAGTYTDKSQAAYWDGRNTFGEPVASGLYFYQLQTNTVSLLRKMLILR